MFSQHREQRRRQRLQEMVRPIEPEIRARQNRQPGEIRWEINCDKQIGQALSLLSRFTGGNLDCSQPSDIQPFINRRLKKPEQN
ncbi:hypothetical protein HMF8227_01155 [Saliniradius amylolyticus]|uniref:Uncharacterized protein n=1 Tax=Saliniradius amylolyticus TaxID=2183582 RepID=A0A2S2E1X0_9ALTE|nr:hypothetical protein HMF8227_01155 [Saliniradius amylolyticus]